MENGDPSNNIHSKRTHYRGNSNSHISMSDTESTASQDDCWHSPYPDFQTENDTPNNKTSKSIVAVSSPGKSIFRATSPAAGGKSCRLWPRSDKPTSENPDFQAITPANGSKGGLRENIGYSGKASSSVVQSLDRLVRSEPRSAVTVVGPLGSVDGRLEEGYGGGAEDEMVRERRSRAAAAASILKRSERSAAVMKVALGVRVFQAISCVISLSVMAADKTQGWSGDSFDRYKEYRYCLGVNVVGLAYSGLEAFALAYHLGSGKHFSSHFLRYHFVFTMDQILAYLLMSASSSAATRVDDWVSNWGKDEFTRMASVSIAMSFLAFIAFALSSLISGYNLCNRDST